jgi:hypothetical protein
MSQSIYLCGRRQRGIIQIEKGRGGMEEIDNGEYLKNFASILKVYEVLFYYLSAKYTVTSNSSAP